MMPRSRMELDMAAHRPPVCCLALAITFLTAVTLHSADQVNCLQIYGKSPRYWQYKNEPALLLKGSKTDYIFLAEELKEHLDEIAAVGANYVRNTMSQRGGVELKPHKRLPGGKFEFRWIDVPTGDWGTTTTGQGGSKVNVAAPGKSGWVAAIVR